MFTNILHIYLQAASQVSNRINKIIDIDKMSAFYSTIVKQYEHNTEMAITTSHVCLKALIECLFNPLKSQ